MKMVAHVCAAGQGDDSCSDRGDKPPTVGILVLMHLFRFLCKYYGGSCFEAEE